MNKVSFVVEYLSDSNFNEKSFVKQTNQEDKIYHKYIDIAKDISKYH